MVVPCLSPHFASPQKTGSTIGPYDETRYVSNLRKYEEPCSIPIPALSCNDSNGVQFKDRMQGNLSALGEVTETLCSLEAALLSALRDENSPAGIAPVADIDDLSGLKSVLDRLRPLLCVYLSRVSENHRTYPMTLEIR